MENIKPNRKRIAILVIGILSVSLVLAGVSYNLLVANNPINIIESQTFQYKIDDGEWVDLDTSNPQVLTLNPINIGAGDYSTFWIKGTNNNKRAIQYTIEIMPNSLTEENMLYDFRCLEEGTRYTSNPFPETENGIVVNVLNEEESEVIIGIDRIVSANTDLTASPLNSQLVMSRGEPTESDWIVC